MPLPSFVVKNLRAKPVYLLRCFYININKLIIANIVKHTCNT